MLASSAIGAQAFVEEALRWLPTDSAETSSPASAIQDILPTPSERSDPDRAHVLLVDDNADMRDYVRRLLSSRWEVKAVADGQAALEAARQRKPDLVVADVMMPHLDGVGLLSALRRDPQLWGVPVILLSARAGEEARAEGLEAGADDYLVKPFSARDLVARVSSHLALSRIRVDELAAMSRLHELSSRLLSVSDLRSVLYEVLDATIELQGADFGNIQLYDKQTRTLEIVAQRGFQQEVLDYFASVDADEGSACGLALKQRSRVIIEDVNLNPDFERHRHIAASAGFRAIQSTPLVDRGSGGPVGMLSTHFRNPHQPSVRELRLTDLYARQAADVIAFRISEQRLRESEARLQAAVDLVGLACYSWNPQTNALQWDKRIKAMWGLPPEVQSTTKHSSPVCIPRTGSGSRRRLRNVPTPEATEYMTSSIASAGSATASNAGLQRAAKRTSIMELRRIFSALRGTSANTRNTKRSCSVSTTLWSCGSRSALRRQRKRIRS
jgi:DNA-binding response OmpR family regulator